ncbi:hypothetical protein L195_g055211 [Trifolium pratense]|uniref:Uncharacterized protein n=2 Tax=Trifolium pratense TaxID=57577 RepID=A0ACB0JL16_TRIPR|nr:hypothetical protein L195_g055211 [Trifolium pratense]CAJ2644536.1 unnamed protein product [Trifolium pratense]
MSKLKLMLSKLMLLLTMLRNLMLLLPMLCNGGGNAELIGSSSNPTLVNDEECVLSGAEFDDDGEGNGDDYIGGDDVIGAFDL